MDHLSSFVKIAETDFLSIFIASVDTFINAVFLIAHETRFMIEIVASIYLHFPLATMPTNE